MKYWKRIDKLGNTYTVESYSFDNKIMGAIEINKAEFDAFIAGLPPTLPIATRDLAEELDTLKNQVNTLAATAALIKP